MVKEDSSRELMDKYWRKTSALLFGAAVDMEGCAGMLRRYTEPVQKDKSALSGVDVFHSSPCFCKGAKFVTFEESQHMPSPKPFSLNDIKDIDSLVRATHESVYYSGSKRLGNSHFVEGSDNIIDSSYVYRSFEIYNCSYIAYGNFLRDSRYMFGCASAGDNSFCVNTVEAEHSARIFESAHITKSSDAYYSYYMRACHSVFFCFNMTGKSHAIGNNELGIERYAELRQSLVEQMGAELKAKKTLPSLMEALYGK